MFLYILSSLVNVRLHTENWLCNLPGSALKVPLVGGGGYRVNLVINFGKSLALAKLNNFQLNAVPVHCQVVHHINCTHFKSIYSLKYFVDTHFFIGFVLVYCEPAI